MANVINEIDFITVDIINYDKKTKLEIRSWLQKEDVDVKFYKYGKEVYNESFGIVIFFFPILDIIKIPYKLFLHLYYFFELLCHS